MTKHVNCMTKHVNVNCMTKHVSCMTKRTYEHASCMTKHVKWSPFSVLHEASSGQCAAQRICVPFFVLIPVVGKACRGCDPINSYVATSPEHRS